MKVLVLDIDGVLTDGTVAASGDANRRIHLRDLDALVRARAAKIQVAFLTGESAAEMGEVVARCGGGSAIYNAKDKVAGLRALAEDLAVKLDDICYVADARRDAAALEIAGLGFTPADADPQAQRCASEVLSRPGGGGAVAAAVDLLLAEACKAKNQGSPQVSPVHLMKADKAEKVGSIGSKGGSSNQNRPVRLLIEVGDGRTAGAMLENGLLEYCRDLGAQCHVLSPGAHFEPFVSRYRLPETEFSYLSVDTVNQTRYLRLRSREARIGRWLCRRGMGQVRRALWSLVGERIAASDADNVVKGLIREQRPDCVLSTNLNLGFGRGLVSRCRRKGIPTVGNIYSWDHPYFEQHSRPDRLTCWSPVVRDGLVSLGGFVPDQVEVIGAPVFDPYLDPEGVCTREELCDRLGFDPARPIILFATLGQMRVFWDETGTFRAFLDAMDRLGLPGPPQVVLRLHPLSVDHYFEEFRSRRDVVFSRYLGYCPGIRVWPKREEVYLAGNLLRHADVCVSPGSTMTIEAAIFDTPTVVPTFNPAIPEEYENYFRKGWLNRHLGFLIREEGMCLAETPDDAIAAVRRALTDKSWLAEGRRAVRENLLGPLDGLSTKRLAKVAVESATRRHLNPPGDADNP